MESPPKSQTRLRKTLNPGLTPTALPRRQTSAGFMILAMILFAIGGGFLGPSLVLGAGLCSWIAALLLWRRLARSQLILVITLIGLGVTGIVIGHISGQPLPIDRVISRNHALLSMLAAVSFLRMVTFSSLPTDQQYPKGEKSYLRTLLGLHLFGSIINISALQIIGDHLRRRGPLDLLTALLLSRGFSTCAFWSPFFGAMATSITYAPNARLGVLMLTGIPLAVMGLGYTWLSARIKDTSHLQTFCGYPLRMEGLLVPLLLTSGVLGLGALQPALPTLTIITLMALIVTLALQLYRSGIRSTWLQINEHLTHRLPTMSGELWLFLSAGVLAVGLDQVVVTTGLTLPIESFNATTAIGVLTAMVVAAAMGVHPIISISALSSLLSPLSPDPTLLGIIFLASWSLGVVINPLSGIHIIMQSRYDIAAVKMVRQNGGYVLTLLLATAALLQGVEYLMD